MRLWVANRLQQHIWEGEVTWKKVTLLQESNISLPRFLKACKLSLWFFSGRSSWTTSDLNEKIGGSELGGGEGVSAAGDTLPKCNQVQGVFCNWHLHKRSFFNQCFKHRMAFNENIPVCMRDSQCSGSDRYTCLSESGLESCCYHTRKKVLKTSKQTQVPTLCCPIKDPWNLNNSAWVSGVAIVDAGITCYSKEMTSLQTIKKNSEKKVACWNRIFINKGGTWFYQSWALKNRKV